VNCLQGIFKFKKKNRKSQRSSQGIWS